MDVHNTLSFVVVVGSSIIVVGTLERYLKKQIENKELCIRHDFQSSRKKYQPHNFENSLVASIFDVLFKVREGNVFIIHHCCLTFSV